MYLHSSHRVNYTDYNYIISTAQIISKPKFSITHGAEALKKYNIMKPLYAKDSRANASSRSCNGVVTLFVINSIFHNSIMFLNKCTNPI